MSRKELTRSLIYAVLVVALLLMPIWGLCDGMQDTISVLKKVISKVENEYIIDISSKQLTISAVKGIVETLDNNSQYLTEDEFDRMRLNARGKYKGIGIEIVKQQDGKILIKSVLKGSPAEVAGVMQNDVIMAVNNDKDLSLSKVTNKVNTDEKIVLEIMRGKMNLKYSILSSTIKVDSTEARIVGDNILYIKITNFIQGTDLLVHKKIKKNIEEYNIESIILDLRNNSGGIFNQALSTAEIFLPKGKTVAITQSKKKKDYYKSIEADYIKLPLVVLINKGTASAAEVVSGALQDTKRAKIIGEQSFGKGSVQSVIPLKVGYGAIKITTATYYTPDGNTIDEIGITPDITVIDSETGTEQLSKAIDLLADYNKLAINK